MGGLHKEIFEVFAETCVKDLTGNACVCGISMISRDQQC
jgi:hypothetical protein